MTPEDAARDLTISIAKHATTGMVDFHALYALCLDALRAYGDARAQAERERCAQIASLVFVNDPYALHPDIHFDFLNESAQTAAHSIAQTIARLIDSDPE